MEGAKNTVIDKEKLDLRKESLESIEEAEKAAQIEKNKVEFGFTDATTQSPKESQKSIDEAAKAALELIASKTKHDKNRVDLPFTDHATAQSPKKNEGTIREEYESKISALRKEMEIAATRAQLLRQGHETTIQKLMKENETILKDLEYHKQENEAMRKDKEITIKKHDTTIQKLMKENETILKDLAYHKQENEAMRKDKEITIKKHDTTIQKLMKENETILKDLEYHKQENEAMRKEIEKAGAETEEVTPDQNVQVMETPLQTFFQWLPECLKPHVAPKGVIGGEELGSFMGSLVTTTAYNVTYSNKDLPGFIIINSTANLAGSVFGQLCKNAITHISETDMEKEGYKKLGIKMGKSILWIFLGGLIPMFAGGFLKNYVARLIVSTVVSFLMQVLLATLWVRSFKINHWQGLGIVVLSSAGIAIAALVPHLNKMSQGV